MIVRRRNTLYSARSPLRPPRTIRGMRVRSSERQANLSENVPSRNPSTVHACHLRSLFWVAVQGDLAKLAAQKFVRCPRRQFRSVDNGDEATICRECGVTVRSEVHLISEQLGERPMRQSFGVEVGT